ncbi:DeoR/GlpR family DNA-binding transcription regulator [Staphylococcus simulans]|uniref:DeoR/GlpR family DNA-binding transcription regulator n=2 Tax=Staphylococcus simulans TaxID=1286 RepID=UPI000D1DD3A0|nr:DeoR/GlpR family DNA-binding transcription regulator [Staphylococcus simulans]PTI87818.1 DeoR/GlpR transcriptional regulator [Staphylococcus simulans]UXR51707.1 DeoR/GlpR family DNA-binding transcription regulator [Staphylococcus simulans]
MLPTERRSKIIEKLEEQEFLELKTLHKELNISMETLRRDIQQLVKLELVQKEYGGIRLNKESNGESAIERRLDRNLTKKKLIAEKALKLIDDGDCIYLDSGSTTLQIAKGLETKRHLTIVTNSIPVLIQCMQYNHALISIGGKVRSSEQSLTQFDFLFNFEHLNINKGFFCCSGLSVPYGVTDYSIEEVETRRRLMNISQQKYLTADSSKINRVVTAKIGELEDFNQLITDDEITNEQQEQFEQSGIKVI